MGVLGKDLLDFHRPRTNTKVEFGASGYWVESHPTMQPYGTVLTEILNLDAAPFQELLDQYRNAVAEANSEQAAQAFQAVANGFASLPLYRLYWDDVQLFASMDVRELFVGEAQEAFCEYAVQDDTLPRFMQEQLDAIRLIQDRYVWFLDSLFAGKPFEKKKGQRKTSLAQQIEKKGLEPFVSGVSLGADSKVDAPKVNAKFCIRGTGREAELVEKMYFDRLLDFVYVEFMKGLQRGFVPKRCANCAVVAGFCRRRARPLPIAPVLRLQTQVKPAGRSARPAALRTKLRTMKSGRCSSGHTRNTTRARCGRI